MSRSVRPSARLACLRAPPGVDALDDVEPLARLDIAEQPCLAGECYGGVGRDEATLERTLLGAQRLDLSRPLLERVAGRDVTAERLVIEEADEAEHCDEEPAD